MKPYTIRLFMWGFQQHYWHSVQFHAERLFQTLNPDFEVETFLLGILNKENSDNHPVCLEPEDCGFKTSDFLEIRTEAEHRQAINPESNVICWDKRHHQSFHARVRGQSYREAVVAQLNGWKKKKPGQYFFSGFMPVAEYDVGVVLRLHHKSEQLPYRLPKVHGQERYGPTHSLVDAAIQEFFHDCKKALDRPAPENVEGLYERSTEELLRKAGDRIMESPVWATGSIEGMYGLFGACNSISSLMYENIPSIGGMIVARDGHSNVHKTLSLAKPVALHRHRAVRKLLQIAETGDALICDGAKVTGFGRIIGNYNQADADLFEIRFTNYYTWELLHAEHRMMRVKNGEPRLPLSPLNETKLVSDITRLFGIKPEESQYLAQLALAACSQRHGALLIVSKEVQQEAERLSSQCTQIVPMKMTPDMITRVTSIDGAVLLAPDATCYAIGVILDGLATPVGDPGRGSRYNSAVRYLQNKVGSLAIVISEDGTAEWMPNLNPQIPRKDLEAAQIEAAALLKLEQLDWDRAWKLINWARNNEFYLPQQLCDEVNELESRFKAMRLAEGGIVVHNAALKPNPAMNDEYLI